MLKKYLEFIQPDDIKNYFIGKSKIHGKGVMAAVPIKANEFINTAMVTLKSRDGNEFFEVTYFGSFINHSYTPSAIIRITNGDYNVYASKDLEPGDEITLDYTTVPNIKQPKSNWK